MNPDHERIEEIMAYVRSLKEQKALIDDEYHRGTLDHAHWMKHRGRLESWIANSMAEIQERRYGRYDWDESREQKRMAMEAQAQLRAMEETLQRRREEAEAIHSIQATIEARRAG